MSSGPLLSGDSVSPGGKPEGFCAGADAGSIGLSGSVPFVSLWVCPWCGCFGSGGMKKLPFELAAFTALVSRLLTELFWVAFLPWRRTARDKIASDVSACGQHCGHPRAACHAPVGPLSPRGGNVLGLSPTNVYSGLPLSDTGFPETVAGGHATLSTSAGSPS